MKRKMQWKRRSLNRKQRKWLFVQDQEHTPDLVQGSVVRFKNSCVQTFKMLAFYLFFLHPLFLCIKVKENVSLNMFERKGNVTLSMFENNILSHEKVTQNFKNRKYLFCF